MTAIELRDIERAYNGRLALDIPSLAVDRGERVALVGPNGCGKTTLLTIAALLMRPDRGDVVVEGERVNWRFPEVHRSSIAFMAQEPYFFRGSLMSNMDFSLVGSDLSRSARTERAGRYLSMLGISQFANRSPGTFSTGERKRAAIARALCRETSILLLDEPFTHIDSGSASVLEEVISNLPDDRTVMFSTHELSYAYRIADTVVTLQGGKLAPWTPENLFQMTAFEVEDGAELRTAGGLAVYFPGDLDGGRRYTVSLNPREVLVSMEPIETSARNSFRGSIRRIETAGPRAVLVTIECPPDFPIRATLTERAVRDFGLSVGDEVWVHFKSTAVHIHDSSSAEALGEGG